VGFVIRIFNVININRCYCEVKTFAELLAIAERDDLDLLGLARQEGCGTHCGWCVAYLRRALQTGETAFHEYLPKEPLNMAEQPDWWETPE
jgi:bacterioferritin-associated ferredoxin